MCQIFILFFSTLSADLCDCTIPSEQCSTKKRGKQKLEKKKKKTHGGSD